MIFSMFIDDERFPPEKWPSQHPLMLARSSADAICLMQIHGCPAFISFDHDLGGEDTAMKIVNWMINQDMDTRHYGLVFIPVYFSFAVHSQNPVGAKNITELLNRYLAFRNSENGNICV